MVKQRGRGFVGPVPVFELQYQGSGLGEVLEQAAGRAPALSAVSSPTKPSTAKAGEGRCLCETIAWRPLLHA
jgi:hypothetical protein